MLKILVLLCPLAVPAGDCTPTNAQAVINVPDGGSDFACMTTQIQMAQRAAGFPPGVYPKVVCERTSR